MVPVFVYTCWCICNCCAIYSLNIIVSDALPTLFEDQTNSDLSAITCFEEYPEAFDGVKESSIAFDCVEESLVAFDCDDISQIAVECVTESQIAFQCDEKSHMSVECVMKNEIEDCVVMFA